MIEETDIKRLHEVFVSRSECCAQHREINDKLGRDYAELAVIKAQLKVITWILTAVGGGIITVIIKLFFGSI